jgi:hypothetical protein
LLKKEGKDQIGVKTDGLRTHYYTGYGFEYAQDRLFTIINK